MERTTHTLFWFELFYKMSDSFSSEEVEYTEGVNIGNYVWIPLSYLSVRVMVLCTSHLTSLRTLVKLKADVRLTFWKRRSRHISATEWSYLAIVPLFRLSSDVHHSSLSPRSLMLYLQEDPSSWVESVFHFVPFILRKNIWVSERTVTLNVPHAYVSLLDVSVKDFEATDTYSLLFDSFFDGVPSVFHFDPALSNIYFF